MDRTAYYKIPSVKFQIVEMLKNREGCFLSKEENTYTVRNIHAHYMSILDSNFEAFHFFVRPYNLYYSLAKWIKITRFNFRPDIRKEQRKVWNENYINNISSFDFGLDFDSDGIEDIMTAWKDAKLIKEDFDKYGVPYSIKFSGGKGFHIRVPFSALPNKKITKDIIDDSLFVFLKTVAEMMVFKYGTKGEKVMETLDLGVFDPRRIWKCDYSWTCETGLIVLPLSDEQFNNFTLDVVRPENVIKMGVYNRGSLERKGSKIGFINYCKEVLGIDV